MHGRRDESNECNPHKALTCQLTRSIWPTVKLNNYIWVNMNCKAKNPRHYWFGLIVIDTLFEQNELNFFPRFFAKMIILIIHWTCCGFFSVKQITFVKVLHFHLLNRLYQYNLLKFIRNVTPNHEQIYGMVFILFTVIIIRCTFDWCGFAKVICYIWMYYFSFDCWFYQDSTTLWWFGFLESFFVIKWILVHDSVEDRLPHLLKHSK